MLVATALWATGLHVVKLFLASCKIGRHSCRSRQIELKYEFNMNHSSKHGHKEKHDRRASKELLE